MLRKIVILVLVFAISGEISRKDAKPQRELSGLFAPLRLCVRDLPGQSDVLPVDVFQVPDLPVSVNEAVLEKTDKGFLLKLALGNGTEAEIVGLRYSLVAINMRNELRFVANRVEGFSLHPYLTKEVTFKTPLKVRPRDGERLALMVEQVVSRESIWEVVKSKEAFEAYAQGDYSVVPTVLRVANQVDSRPEDF